MREDTTLAKTPSGRKYADEVDGRWGVKAARWRRLLTDASERRSRSQAYGPHFDVYNVTFSRHVMLNSLSWLEKIQ